MKKILGVGLLGCLCYLLTSLSHIFQDTNFHRPICPQVIYFNSLIEATLCAYSLRRFLISWLTRPQSWELKETMRGKEGLLWTLIAISKPVVVAKKCHYSKAFMGISPTLQWFSYFCRMTTKYPCMDKSEVTLHSVGYLISLWGLYKLARLHDQREYFSSSEIPSHFPSWLPTEAPQAASKRDPLAPDGDVLRSHHLASRTWLNT